MDIGDLKAKVKLDYSGFDRGVKKITGGFKSLYRNAINLNQSVELVKNGYRGMEAMAKATVGSLLEAANTAESYRLRLNAMLGSQQEGTRMFKEMATFAGKVPYEYEKIMDAATTLSGVMQGGVDEVQQWMPLITDLAAASGLSIEETTGQIVRMYSAGAGAADLFRERGITAMLGFKAGVSYTAEETKKILMEAYESPTSKFRSLTKEMAKTWDGQVSMMKDKWFLFRNEIMDSGPFVIMKAALGEVNKAIDEMVKDGSLKTYAKQIGKVLLDGIDAAITGAKALAHVFTGMYQSVLFIQEGFHRIAAMVPGGSVKKAAKTSNFNMMALATGFVTGDYEAALKLAQANSKDVEQTAKSAKEAHKEAADQAHKRAMELQGMLDGTKSSLDDMQRRFRELREQFKNGTLTADEAKKTPFATGQGTEPEVSDTEPEVSDEVKKARKLADSALSSAMEEKGKIGLDGYAAGLEEIKIKYGQLTETGDAMAEKTAQQWRKIATENLNATTQAEMNEDLRNTQIENMAAGMGQLEGAAYKINQEFANLSADMPSHLQAIAEELKNAKLEEAFNNIVGKTKSFSVQMREALSSMRDQSASLMTDFFMTFADEGKLDFSGLAKGLLQMLKMTAAQYTTKNLMDAAFYGIQGLIANSNIYTAWQAPMYYAQAEMSAASAAIWGSFVAGSGLAGMAHDGMSSIPEDGTWLLQKGERVVDSRTNEDLKGYLNGGGGGTTINMPVTIQNSDEDGVKKALPALKQTIIDVVTGNIAGNGEIRKTIKGYT